MERNDIYNPKAIQSTQTAEVDLVAPDPHTIAIADVALSLGRTVRYNGLNPWPVPVLIHSLLCVHIAETDPNPEVVVDDLTKLAVLLHDGHEAYLGDDSRPKKKLYESYMPEGTITRLEHNLDNAIMASLGVNRHELFEQRPLLSKLIKRVDNMALSAEVHLTFPHVLERWGAIPPENAEHIAKLDHLLRVDVADAIRYFVRLALDLSGIGRETHPEPTAPEEGKRVVQ